MGKIYECQIGLEIVINTGVVITDSSTEVALKHRKPDGEESETTKDIVVSRDVVGQFTFTVPSKETLQQVGTHTFWAYLYLEEGAKTVAGEPFTLEVYKEGE